jgi:hypothetical protein
MSEPATDLFRTIAQKLNDEQKRAATELILLNPDLLVTLYKNSQSLLSEAERFINEGNMLVAENRLASAAKLALYEGNPDSAKKYLEKCLTVSQTNNSAYKIASSNFDAISQCVMEFYKAKSGGATGV